MEVVQEAPYFPHAYRIARMDGNFSELKQCVVRPHIMNKEDCRWTGMYPLAAIVDRRFDSNLVITALMSGASVDFKDSKHRSLFHWIADGYRISFGKPDNYCPKKNLLGALVLPAHGAAALCNKTESIARLKTALLCLNKINPQLKAGSIKYCILGHLTEDIYNAKLLGLVLTQRIRPELYIGKYPLAWIQSVLENTNSVDRPALAKKYAQAFAFYRINNVLPLLKRKDIDLRTAYQTALNNARWAKQLGVNSPESIKDSQNMVELFNPRGFVHRHLPECTHIVSNLLHGKEPFDGFDPF